jgi:hypothetical protein
VRSGGDGDSCAKKRRSHLGLWDCAMGVHITKLRNFTTRGQNGRTGYDEVTGEMPMEEYYANVIAENLFAQVDSKGHQYVLMKEISNPCKDETAIPTSSS